MSITNLSLLSNVVHGVPSGNYDGSSLDFDSDGVKAVGYYAGQGSLQTVTISVQNFTGRITLQATLDINWESAAWFDVYEYSADPGPLTDFHPVNLTGNFSWIRARVQDFQTGTIESINIAY